ncbi:MAG: alpha/beta hydrolase [Actinomycetota bacterium]|nr:alpha/beta hydrolase [Actinomycetota bacterium]
MTDQHKEVQLPQGTIRYREAGEGKPVVFVHGYLVDSRLWEGVVDSLSDRFRCIAPDWPLAAHRTPMNPDADLSPPGLARLISDFLTKLELDDVTIVGNDSGGAISQVLVTTYPDRIGRLVLTNCDTHENFPPGPFKAMPPIAKLPGGMLLISAPFRIEAIARRAFAPFAKTKIPDELIASWMEPAKSDSKILRDAGKVTAGMNKRHTLAAAEKLRGSQLPIRLLWAPSDKVFPLSYAERLAGEAGNAELVQIPDAGTFVPLDQPERVAKEIADFATSP